MHSKQGSTSIITERIYAPIGFHFQALWSDGVILASLGFHLRALGKRNQHCKQLLLLKIFFHKNWIFSPRSRLRVPVLDWQVFGLRVRGCKLRRGPRGRFDPHPSCFSIRGSRSRAIFGPEFTKELVPFKQNSQERAHKSAPHAIHPAGAFVSPPRHPEGLSE